MNRTSWMKLFNIYMICFIVVAFTGVLLALIFSNFSSWIIESITFFATLTGVVAVFVEYKRNEAIGLANRLISMYSDFQDYPDNRMVQYKLECLKRRNKNLFTKNDITAIRAYLSYFESISSLFTKGMVSFKHINSILGYRFFLIMNSPYIQQLEIIPNAENYKGAILMHYMWSLWAKKNNFHRSGDATSLEKNFSGYYALLGISENKAKN